MDKSKKEWSQATIRFNIHTSVNQLLCPVISWRNPLFLFTAATTLRSHIFYHVDILWYSFNQRFEIYLFKYPVIWGYAELILGLIDSFVPGYGLLFWVAGFGLFHIIYGVFFYLKYDRRKLMKPNLELLIKPLKAKPRLGIMSILMVNDSVDFTTIKNLLESDRW